MWREFKAFLVKENVLALALAVVIGAAMGKLVTAIVNDFIMPIIAVVTPAGNWRTATLDIGPVQFLVGDFLSVLLDFLIVAFVVWRISKAFIGPAPATAKPATRECPYCVSAIDARATRCAHCTATIDRKAA
ncbi:MAG: large conductance mechanosensitive channel protein MscL [Gemmatimonadaceae bacterium]